MADRPTRLVVQRLHAASHVAGWVGVAYAALALATQLIGTPTGWIAALQSLTPWTTLPLVGLAVFAAATHHDRLGFVTAVVAVAHLVVVTPLVFPDRGPAAAPGAEPISVTFVNLLYSNERVEEAADSLFGADADVITLAELTSQQLAVLSAHPLAGRYPYRVERPRERSGGLLLWSKLPIHSRTGTDELRRSIDVILDAPDGALRVVVVHPPPPVFDHSVWDTEIAALPSVVAESATPTVVVGDFNASYFHPPFRTAVDAAGLLDAHAAVGQGMTPTWPTDEWIPPFVTLDHVLISSSLAVLDAGRYDLPGSDHRAIWARIAAAG